MSVKMIFCLRRRAELSREEFQRYWLKDHAPKVREVAEKIGMTGYVQSHTYDSAMGASASRARGSSEDYDGVMEGWWDSEEAARTAFSTHGPEATLMLLDDERRFIDFERSALFMTCEHIIF